MNRSILNKFSISNHKKIILSLFCYFVVGCILVPFYRYSQRGDIVSYLSISEKYINGNFSDAVNGVWSPLLSWLLIPFFLMDIEILLGFKILQLMIGAFIIFIVLKYSELLGIRKNYQHYLLLGTTSIIIYYFTFFLGSPDLLVAALLFYYLFNISKISYLVNPTAGLKSGILGSIAFYSKAFSFPFFILHFTLINVYYLYLYPSHRNKIKKNYLHGMGLFILVCSIWILIISLKYDYFTYSTASAYNFNIIGPKYESINTFRINALFPPSNETAVSYWEDPTFLPIEKWHPFSSPSNLIFFFEHIISNVVLMLYYIFIFSPFFLFLLIFKFKDYKTLDPILTVALVTIFTYSLGYVTLFIYERFVILIYILVIALSFWFMIDFIESLNKSKLKKVIFFSIFIASIIAKPIYSTIKFYNEGEDLNILSKILERKKISGSYAGISKKPLDVDWSNTLFLAYRSKSQFYGEVNPDQEIEIIFKELKKYNIDYLFDWRNDVKIVHPNFEKILDLKMTVEEKNPFDKIISTLDVFKEAIKAKNQRITGSNVKVYKMIYHQ